MYILITFFFKLFAAMPLRLMHALAGVLGCAVYYLRREDRERVFDNMRTAGLQPNEAAVKAVFRETVKGGLELPVAFFRRPESIEKLFVEVRGWEHVQAALDAGEGLLFITPHIGSYDLAGRYISQQLPFPLTAMYKPPKLKAMDEVMQAGRVRGKGKTAPTSI